jgi:hypothetical protein
MRQANKEQMMKKIIQVIVDVEIEYRDEKYMEEAIREAVKLARPTTSVRGTRYNIMPGKAVLGSVETLEK